MLLLFLLVVVAGGQPLAYNAVELRRCPYEILGVARSASLAEVRAGYRKMAREAHPDKSKDSELFLEVAAAFEFLSDDEERRRYERTGDLTSRARRDSQVRRRTHDTRRRLTEKEKRAQARVQEVNSRKHLEEVVGVTNSGVLKRFLLLALYEPGPCEDFLTYRTKFPYPFGDRQDAHGIWWEDVLQPTKARLSDLENATEPSRLARKFRIGSTRQCPVIIFAKETFEDFDIIKRPEAENFEFWLWPLLASTVTFENQHSRPIRVFWIRGGQAFDPFDLEPGQAQTRTAYISHLFAARDVKSGGPLTKNSALAWDHITTDVFRFTIKSSKCIDYHGDCTSWAEAQECQKNPSFMLAFCGLSCANHKATAKAARALDKATRAKDIAAKALQEAQEARLRAQALEHHAAQLRQDAILAEEKAQEAATQQRHIRTTKG